MGISQGILSPKPSLKQLGLVDVADLQVNGDVIEIRPLKRNPREGWAQDSQRLAATGDDAMMWPSWATRGMRSWCGEPSGSGDWRGLAGQP
jgi:antitoxin MazE